MLDELKIESCCRTRIILNIQLSSAVIYSIVIRSFSHRSPFQKGKNEGNISKNDGIKNDATSGPEGAQSNVGDKYATLLERWRK